MASAIVTLALAFAASSAGQGYYSPATSHPYNQHPLLAPGGRILAPGPGLGWGFRNGNPDGVGWFDHGTALPLGSDRVAEYYFPRYHALPPNQLFLPSYYNAYVTRGQRYLPYAGAGGEHPAGGYPMGSSSTPVHPYQDTIGNGPKLNVPAFTGRVGAQPIPSGATGLTP